MIEVKNINKIYKVGGEDFYALRDACLTVNDGDMVAIQGASGSGKTTLLNILGCLDRPTSGSYTLNGQEVVTQAGRALSDRKQAGLRNREIGFVLQDFALIDSKTVLYNVMLPLLFSKTPYRKCKSKALGVLAKVGLTDQARKKANRLSGGQRQRVAIARALVNDPQLILADEPTGQLDSATGEQIMELLAGLNRSGITVLIVTHDDHVASYCRRRCYISDGVLTEEGMGDGASSDADA